MEFGKQFYPTPNKVIKKMLEPYTGKVHRGGINGRMVDSYTLTNKHILDPSAGKGNILKYIINEFDRYTKPKLYAIELDFDLQDILKSNDDINLIHNDFLTYNDDIFFNLILMNPPFANGDEHLLKAWEILIEGDIVCLLNKETIDNPYSKTRELLSNIIKENGSVEYFYLFTNT